MPVSMLSRECLFVATALTGSQVSLAKGGYAVVAIDSRVAGGPWVQIGISMTATYVDGRAPLVAGAPELREYRAQGMVDNARVRALSAIGQRGDCALIEWLAVV